MLTLAQSMQLVGLVPCLFVAAFLLSQARRNRQVLVPIGYFLSLACGFALPLADILLSPPPRLLAGGLLFGESVLVAFGFLLILQFMTGRVPAPPYWLVLAIPLVGGGGMMYASLAGDSAVCLSDQICTDLASARTLYHVFGSSLVFLLLVYYAARLQPPPESDHHRRHKYWLMVALITLHLFVLAVELAHLSGRLTPEQARFIETILRLTFIYLVITSLFRVFYPALVTRIVEPAAPRYNPDADLPHVATLKALLESGHVYREMRLNRARLAKKIGIGEHHFSRMINHHFGQSFNELINGYRIEEAKHRLKFETTAVTTIAFEVGFNSIASFNRVFHKKTGMSPTEFRANPGAPGR